jgi:hypothetical protein
VFGETEPGLDLIKLTSSAFDQEKKGMYSKKLRFLDGSCSIVQAINLGTLPWI